MDPALGPITGIDLGTTFSSIAFLNAFGRAEVIPAADGARSVPSVVLFDPATGEAVVGREAKERSVECPDRVVEFVKREMGDPDWTFHVDGRDLRPQTISAVILRKLVDMSERTLGQRPDAAVITCPAYFGDLERQATSDAGTLAGLEVLSVFNEPTAAALAYGLHHAAKDTRVRALVYDLGGGTFDVTILELRGRRVEVLATAGEHRLGGKDWDDELLNHVAEEFVAEYGEDPRDDLGAMQDLRNRCEAAKVMLSTKRKAKLFCRAHEKTLKVDLTRVLFEELTRPLLLQTRTYLDQVLQMARLRWEDIDVVLPVGGSSHMPQVRQLLRECTGRSPEETLDPDLAVVQGAVYFAALLRAEQGFSIKVRAVRQPTGRQAKEAAEELLGLPPASAPLAEEEELPALPPATLQEAPEVLPALPGAVGAAEEDEELPALPPALAPDEPMFAVPMLPGAVAEPARQRAPAGRPGTARAGGPGRPGPGRPGPGPGRPGPGAGHPGAAPPGRRPTGAPRRPGERSSDELPGLPAAPAARDRSSAEARALPPATGRPGPGRPAPGRPAAPRGPARPPEPVSSAEGRALPRRPQPASAGPLPPRAPHPSDEVPALPSAAPLSAFEGGITDTARFDFRDLVALDELSLESAPAAQAPSIAFGAPPGPPPPIPQRRQRAVSQVNARSLGVLIHRNGQPAVRVMIQRNSRLPATDVSQFYTINDNQTGVKVVVLEGDDPDPERCVRIGECVISGLPARPKGQPIEIGYSYDEDGQIRVYARDLGSGQSARVDLQREGSLDRRAMAEAAAWLDGVCR
ncbi:MAG: Hsp70 family protein [Planctomycetota bacterium]